MCRATLDQFMLRSFADLGKGRKPNLCGSVLYMPLSGVAGWRIILVSSMTNVQASKFCGKRLGVWPLFGVKEMIILEKFPSLIC